MRAQITYLRILNQSNYSSKMDILICIGNTANPTAFTAW